MRHGIFFRAVVRCVGVGWLSLAALQAVEPHSTVSVAVSAPFATQIPCGLPAVNQIGHLEAEVTLPNDAPPTLRALAWMVDQHGQWFSSQRAVELHPGSQHVVLALTDGELAGEPRLVPWNAAARALVVRGGLSLLNLGSVPVRVAVEQLEIKPAPFLTLTQGVYLSEVECAASDPVSGISHGQTGQRWSFSLRPTPFPANPDDPEDFRLTAWITAPDGREQPVAGFFHQPQMITDGGDRELVQPSASGAFTVRYRPAQPGRYRVRITAQWRSGAQVAAQLPDLVVTGQPWAGYVHLKRSDPRFFALTDEHGDDQWWWPIGLNLHAIWDDHSARTKLATTLTPNRVWFAYEAYLQRLHAHGIDACEIWLSSWSLGLEWHAEWAGYHGIGRYNQGNAERLDRLLDLAEQLGIRVLFTISNHGIAAEGKKGTNSEWPENPWSRANGGPLAHAAEQFTDPRALQAQANLRRYIIARYGDSPAILAWKLWSEQDQTGVDRDTLFAWHQHACAAWRAEDPYQHLLNTHWAWDHTYVDQRFASIPQLEIIGLDAYHRLNDSGAVTIAKASVGAGSLLSMKRPLWIQEFGVHPGGASPVRMDAEHRLGPWLSLVSGQAGSAMLWWSEWVDQGERWQPYHAIRAFISGEDLPSTQARAVTLSASPGLQAQAWMRPGRAFGYVFDQDWIVEGGPGQTHADATVLIGDDVQPGTLTLSWWNADTGAVIANTSIKHPGGRLELVAPTFNAHVAFKLFRQAQ